mmetsp:Transcript_12054/g.25928  ORF Transcript_12054/g.25928 Transcript_12054/m.25928 type:complete len:240 (-) Transcript_12054:631-1350(-)
MRLSPSKCIGMAFEEVDSEISFCTGSTRLHAACASFNLSTSRPFPVGEFSPCSSASSVSSGNFILYTAVEFRIPSTISSLYWRIYEFTQVPNEWILSKAYFSFFCIIWQQLVCKLQIVKVKHVDSRIPRSCIQLSRGIVNVCSTHSFIGSTFYHNILPRTTITGTTTFQLVKFYRVEQFYFIHIFLGTVILLSILHNNLYPSFPPILVNAAVFWQHHKNSAIAGPNDQNARFFTKVQAA